jgi:hypothetical protein
LQEQNAPSSFGGKLVAIVKTETDPAQLASKLMEAGSAESLALNPECAEITGHDHCEHCAMPMVTMLVEELTKVKDEIWTERASMDSEATTTCTDVAPASRAGGAAKCCASAVNEAYSLHGYTQCEGDTFDAVMPIDAASIDQLERGSAGSPGFTWRGNHHSQMVSNCCAHKSVCAVNERKYTAKMSSALTGANSMFTKKEGAEDAVKATVVEQQYLAGQMQMKSNAIDDICKTADGMVPTVDTQCVSGTITREKGKAVAKSATALANVKSIMEAHKVVTKAMQWLDNGEALINGDEDGLDPTTSAPQAQESSLEMLALLESTKAASKSDVATQALKQTMMLVQNSKAAHESTGFRVVQTTSEVVEILKQLLENLQQSADKSKAYAGSVATSSQSQVATLMTQLGAMIDERSTVTEQQAQEIDSEAKHRADLAFAVSMVEDHKNEYLQAWKTREINAQKCTAYMVYFDSEYVSGLGELLVLKRSLDIIKHIKCDWIPPNPPTAAPTSPYTNPPTAKVDDTQILDAFEAPAATPAPTAKPTAAAPPQSTSSPTPFFGCEGGKYFYESKVFHGPEADKFSVPQYAQFQPFAVKAAIAGECQEVHAIGGDDGTQTVISYYKCCEQTGKFYGEVPFPGSPSMCTSGYDFCGMLGSNMDPIGTEDHSEDHEPPELAPVEEDEESPDQPTLSLGDSAPAGWGEAEGVHVRTADHSEHTPPAVDAPAEEEEKDPAAEQQATPSLDESAPTDWGEAEGAHVETADDSEHVPPAVDAPAEEEEDPTEGAHVETADQSEHTPPAVDAPAEEEEKDPAAEQQATPSLDESAPADWGEAEGAHVETADDSEHVPPAVDAPAEEEEDPMAGQQPTLSLAALDATP